MIRRCRLRLAGRLCDCVVGLFAEPCSLKKILALVWKLLDTATPTNRTTQITPITLTNRIRWLKSKYDMTYISSAVPSFCNTNLVLLWGFLFNWTDNVVCWSHITLLAEAHFLHCSLLCLAFHQGNHAHSKYEKSFAYIIHLVLLAGIIWRLLHLSIFVILTQIF